MAMLFAAGCSLTPGAGAADGDCPEQPPAQEAPASGGAAAIAETARSIADDANEIAGLSRQTRRDARSIASVANQIATDADRLAAAEGGAEAEAAPEAEADAGADAEAAAPEGDAAAEAGDAAAAAAAAAEGDAAADAAAQDTEAAAQGNQGGGEEVDAAAAAQRMTRAANFIGDRADRIARQSRNAQVDELAAGIGTKADEVAAAAAALGEGGAEPPATTVPEEDCEEPTETTTGEGDPTEPTETTTEPGDPTEPTTDPGDPNEPVTTVPPTTTPAPIDVQNCDPQGLREHTGVQTRDDADVCHQGILGVLPGINKTPQVRILEPANGETLPVGQPYECTIRFINWTGGLFDDPASQYGVRPFGLGDDGNGRQVPLGHSHCYVQALPEDGSVPNIALDNFVALNNPPEDGETLTGTLTGVAEPGDYRLCVDLAGGNHLTFPKGVAQVGPQADCVRITFE